MVKKQNTIKTTQLIWIILIVMNIGCDKQEEPGEWLDAIVLDLGSPSVDGCGFLIEIEQKIYYPINLAEKHHIDKKHVKVRYNALEGMYTCGFPHSNNKFPRIEIIDIKNQ